MPFKKGQSGNPKGRPKQERALSRLIEKALSKTELLPDRKRVARKRLMANHLAEAVSTGKLTFWEADGIRVLTLKADEWSDLVMKILKHIEGDKHELTADLLGNFSHQVEGFDEMLERVYDSPGNVPDNSEEE